MKKLIFSFFVLTLLPLAAQTSSLQGVVTDPKGALIPEAALSATNVDTSTTRSLLSDAEGKYSFLQVPPGTYKVQVQKPGFAVFSEDVRLQINAPATLNIQLEIGQATQTVNVVAEASAVNSVNATVGSPFTEIQVKELPLQTRNVVALLGQQAGVSSTGQVLGARPDQNNVMLDGADVNDSQGANGFTAVLPIPLDSVQEFRTTIAGQGADLGHSSGGQVSIVTKGGSNKFSGSLYEYNRNTLFEANDWFSNKAGVARPALVRNQYGASVGGPILKNKLFFFYNWEGRKDRSATAKTAAVPSENLKQGIVKVALKDGRTVDLSPSVIVQLDPLHIGANPAILALMQKYPVGNNPSGATDKGLNITQLLFNAPQPLNNHAEVARLDYNLDKAGKHTIMLRGTLNGASQVPGGGVALFPGYAASSQTLDNSRGIAVRYTTVFTPRLVNVAAYGLTRLGVASTGTSAVVPTFGFTALQPTNRASGRIAPTDTYTDDLTYTSGRHSIQGGFAYRYIDNLRTTGGSFPSYSYNRATLANLGADMTNNVTPYIQSVYGSTAALASTTNVQNAFGALFGLLNNYGATYQTGVDGKAIPFGTPIARDFVSKSPEFYIQDTFKASRSVTVTAGLRYSVFGVPYEANGVEVLPQTSLNQYFADRVGAQLYGIADSTVPNALVTYQLGGPFHGGKGYYSLDKKDFAPRLALAYSPGAGTMAQKVMGKDSAFRIGAGMVYDNYGNAMAQAFSSGGSPGLSSAVQQPVNTNFSTSYRWDGSNFPALQAPATGAFPYTPGVITGGFTSFTGVADNLKAPYEYLLNANYARPLAKGLSIELGYAGRLSHRGIVQQDFGQPLMNFKDPISGQTLVQAGAILGNLFNNGLTAAQVKANPTLVPTIPFFENMFPNIVTTDKYVPGGSASANFFYDVYGNFGGSYTDSINDMDRIRTNGQCISRLGCNTFFPLQNSGLPAYVNAGKSAYHAATIVLRRAVQHGWGFDFNYTWSHGLDNGSSSETSGGAALQDAFNPNAYRGPSDFDARQQISANTVVGIPIGRGKALFNTMPKWLDTAVGGWQASALYTFRTALPVSCSSGAVYNVNYLNSALCVLKPGSTLPSSGLVIKSNGAPAIYADSSVASDFVASNVGVVGTRGMFRGLPFWNADVSVSKSFKLPREGMTLSLRGEGYNVFNHVSFSSPSLSLANASTFGEITSTTSTPRVLQVAARLEF